MRRLFAALSLILVPACASAEQAANRPAPLALALGEMVQACQQREVAALTERNALRDRVASLEADLAAAKKQAEGDGAKAAPAAPPKP